MSTLDEINEDWQVNGLSPTWTKLQQAKQEQAALIAERDALKAELERIKALPPVGFVQHLNELNDEWLSRLPIGTPLYALGGKTV